MSKFKINWVEKKVGKSGKEYLVMHLVDEAGKETQNVSTFTLTYMAGQEIEGEIVQNGNFLNWKAKLEAPEFIKKGASTFMMEKKATQIAEAQTKKAQSIAEAQDRSALMWAKYGACEIVAHHPAFKELDGNEVVDMIEKLFTRIYNGEPLEPFN